MYERWGSIYYSDTAPGNNSHVPIPHQFDLCWPKVPVVDTSNFCYIKYKLELNAGLHKTLKFNRDDVDSILIEYYVRLIADRNKEIEKKNIPVCNKAQY